MLSYSFHAETLPSSQSFELPYVHERFFPTFNFSTTTTTPLSNKYDTVFRQFLLILC